MMSNKSFSDRRRLYQEMLHSTSPSLQPGTDILEFEVRGKVIERVKVASIELPVWIDQFYEEYDLDGVAYVILASRMNFENFKTDDE